MKKIMLIAVMVTMLLGGRQAFAGEVLESLATAVGQGVAASMGGINGVINVTSTTTDSEISGKNVEVGVVELGGIANAAINVTTIGGKIAPKETAKVGVVAIE